MCGGGSERVRKPLSCQRDTPRCTLTPSHLPLTQQGSENADIFCSYLNSRAKKSATKKSKRQRKYVAISWLEGEDGKDEEDLIDSLHF